MTETGLVHHYRVLKQFLDISDDTNSRNKPNSTRAARAREKLLKLSEGQFKELSTDVYDELRRRIDESRGEPDYLLPKSSFHPKRNQARQKLSSLPQSRFKDLVSDISYEIERRNLHIAHPAADSNSVASSSHGNNNVGNGANDGLSHNNSTSTNQSSNTKNNHYNNKSFEYDPTHDTTHESKTSKVSNGSDVPNQTIGVSNKTVVPTKANLTWSSEEEDNGDDDQQIEPENAPLSQPEGFDRNISHTDDNKLNGAVIDTSNDQRLKDQASEIEQLKTQLDLVQQELDETLDKNFTLSKTIESFKTEKEEWEATRSSYESKLTKLSEEHDANLSQVKGDYELKLSQSHDKTEYEALLKEFEQIKSQNATLRLENQSLKNAANASSRDHTRSNSMNTLSRDLNSMDAAGTVSPSGNSSTGSPSQGFNKHMEQILEKLSNLDSKLVADKKPSFIHLRNDVISWQKKYEDLRANKILKEFNNNLLSSKQLQTLTTDDGLISISSVTKFQSLIEVLLNYIDGKEFNSDILFEKISVISLLANDIANQADNTRLNSNENAVNVRDCASHVLSIMRYYTIYSDILPKVVVERSINELVFSVCDLVGNCKISLNDNHLTVDKEALLSSSMLLSQADNDSSFPLPPPGASNLDHSNSGSLYNARLDDDDNSSIGVRPLRMADRLRNNSSMASLENSREVSPQNEVRRGLPLHNDSTTSINSSNSKVNNAASKYHQQQLNNNTYVSSIDKDQEQQSKSTTPNKKSNILDRVKQFESPPPADKKDKSSFSPGSENESTSNSFILNRSSLEMKKSPKGTVIDKFGRAHLEKKTSNDSESKKSGVATATVGAAVGVAAGVGAGTIADRANKDESLQSGKKGIFQSIRDKFTEQQAPEQAQEIDDSVSDVKQDASTDNVLDSTAQTTPFREEGAETVSPQKSQGSIPASATTMDNEVPSHSKLDESENTQALNSLAGDGSSSSSSPLENKKKVTISNDEPREIISNNSQAMSHTINTTKNTKLERQEREVEGEEETDEEESEDEQTTQARQRQEQRKSMAAATFNVDLFDIDDPDNTITQVLLYLEHQTVEVITTIQLLLAAIKKPNVTRGDLRDKSKAIADVISQMTEATNTSMNQTRNAQLKEHGSWVVQNLEDCCHRMNIICKTSKDKNDLDFADRSFKQRLAGISYDIAKCTKELVKAVEEASLKEDIANLDARLSHGDDLT